MGSYTFYKTKEIPGWRQVLQDAGGSLVFLMSYENVWEVILSIRLKKYLAGAKSFRTPVAAWYFLCLTRMYGKLYFL